jgi:hypothetical protein
VITRKGYHDNQLGPRVEERPPEPTQAVGKETRVEAEEGNRQRKALTEPKPMESRHVGQTDKTR